jgi:hypothetical protein
VSAKARQGIQVRRQGRDECLAFASAHLGNLSLMQRNAANQLDVEVAHAKRSSPCFTNSREGFREHAVERLTFCETLSERRREARKGIVWQAAHLFIVRIGGNY